MDLWYENKPHRAVDKTNSSWRTRPCEVLCWHHVGAGAAHLNR